MTATGRITTRVRIDDLIGPYEALVDPNNLYRGRPCPLFTLDTVRQLAARTDELTVRDGYQSETVAVLDGGTDSDGKPRAVVLVVSWMYLDEGTDTACTFIEPDDDGLYDFGCLDWCWAYASWWCACGEYRYWHETDCAACDLTRDTQPPQTPCDCGCDPWPAGPGAYDLTSEISRAHFEATGRYLRWTESAQRSA